MKKVLAVASGGGHWIQLLRLRPAFKGSEIRFVTTHKGFSQDVDEKIYTVIDANMNHKIKALIMFIQMLWIVLFYRPDVIITTGAAPGFSAIFWGRLLGAKTIWLDSIANAEELSRSGKQAKKFADIWLTQWKHIETPSGPTFRGKIL